MYENTVNNKTKTAYLLGFSRIFTGLLFIFSGLIKANDPTGFGYKLQEYFEVFHLAGLNDYATSIAVVICSIEIILGVLLLLGLYANLVAWGLLLLILFFTFLTFYSAFFDVVTSCGCFGDAIPLTPWESFAKDLILLVFILIIFINRKSIKPIVKDAFNQGLVTAVTVAISIAVGVYTVNFLPVVDFLPYKVGNHIPSLMIMPEGKQADVYEQVYTMKNLKTAAEKKVTDKVYLAEKIWEDKDWEIIGEPESKLLKKGYTIPITDLMIYDANGEDHTHELIENPYYNLIVVARDLKNTHTEALSKINNTVTQLAADYNLRAVILTTNSSAEMDYLSGNMGLIFENFYADAVPLKSMVRANPGVLLLKNGTIINKWHFNSFPTAEVLASKYLNKDK